MPTFPNSRLPAIKRFAACAALTAAALFAIAQPTETTTEPPLAEAPAELLASLEAEVVAMDSLRRFGIAKAPAKPEGSVRIATYNILNLFDAHDDPALTGDKDDAGMTKPLHESVAAARAIRAVNADILCLQEVESLEALTEFRDTLLADMGYTHIVSLAESGDDRGIENAVLSRFPIVHTQIWPGLELGGIHPDKYGNQENWFAGQPVAFRRSPLRVDIQIPGSDEPWTFFVVHHKSGRFSEYWREAESKAVVSFAGEITKEHPNRPILVLGDFNAESSAPSVKNYLSAGFDEIFANRPQTDAIITHESGRRIDLILANPAAKAQLLADKAFVLGTPARPAGISYRDLPTMPGIASDHYPVVVDTAPTEAPQKPSSGN